MGNMRQIFKTTRLLWDVENLFHAYFGSPALPGVPLVTTYGAESRDVRILVEQLEWQFECDLDRRRFTEHMTPCEWVDELLFQLTPDEMAWPDALEEQG